MTNRLILQLVTIIMSLIIFITKVIHFRSSKKHPTLISSNFKLYHRKQQSFRQRNLKYSPVEPLQCKWMSLIIFCLELPISLINWEKLCHPWFNLRGRHNLRLMFIQIPNTIQQSLIKTTRNRLFRNFNWQWTQTRMIAWMWQIRVTTAAITQWVWLVIG